MGPREFNCPWNREELYVDNSPKKFFSAILYSNFAVFAAFMFDLQVLPTERNIIELQNDWSYLEKKNMNYNLSFIKKD